MRLIWKTKTSVGNSVIPILKKQLPVPYYVDVVDYGSLEQPELKNHITRVGKTLYKL
ncbi:hypothetical protein K8S19_08025 [bacterium]|nr:hypothetical protein [bacterium]